MGTSSAVPAPSGTPRSLPLREIRSRLTQLVALAELTGAVTLVTRDNDPRPIAAIGPAAIADRDAGGGRSEARAAGWERRVEQVRANLRRRHQAELNAVFRALDQVWAELDRHVRPGVDRSLDQLRAAHARLPGR